MDRSLDEGHPAGAFQMGGEMSRQRRLAICAGASAGGHLNELLRLLDAANGWPAQPSMFVTSLPEGAPALASRGPVTVIGECTRRTPIKAIGVLVRAVMFAWRERPDVVITTGALPLAMVCAATKLLGARVVWIDSFSKTERLSISGQFVRCFADLFLVQWPELEERYGGVEYVGALV